MCMHTLVCMCLHVCAHACLCLCVHACVFMCACMCMHEGMCVYMHVCMCTCMCVCACVKAAHAQARGWPQMSSSITLHLTFWDRLFLIEPRAHCLLRLAGSELWASSCLSCSGVPLDFYVSTEDQNSRPHVWAANTIRPAISVAPLDFSEDFLIGPVDQIICHCKQLTLHCLSFAQRERLGLRTKSSNPLIILKSLPYPPFLVLITSKSL